jgi:hypothetical protein
MRTFRSGSRDLRVKSGSFRQMSERLASLYLYMRQYFSWSNYHEFNAKRDQPTTEQLRDLCTYSLTGRRFENSRFTCIAVLTGTVITRAIDSRRTRLDIIEFT